MFRRITAALVAAIFVVAFATATTGAQNVQSDRTTAATVEQDHNACVGVTAYKHNRLVRRTLRYSAHGGDYRASRPTSKQLSKLGFMRSCAKHTAKPKFPFEYANMRDFWKKRKTVWAFHKHIDEITVYGKWAIPEYIVMRESRGNACAKNPSSTAGGYYQFLSSTWAAYGGSGGTAMCAPSWEQHEVAARAWAGGSGSSHWALTR